jgi:hypothetical protein
MPQHRADYKLVSYMTITVYVTVTAELKKKYYIEKTTVKTSRQIICFCRFHSSDPEKIENSPKVHHKVFFITTTVLKGRNRMYKQVLTQDQVFF